MDSTAIALPLETAPVSKFQSTSQGKSTKKGIDDRLQAAKVARQAQQQAASRHRADQLRELNEQARVDRERRLREVEVKRAEAATLEQAHREVQEETRRQREKRTTSNSARKAEMERKKAEKATQARAPARRRKTAVKSAEYVQDSGDELSSTAE